MKWNSCVGGYLHVFMHTCTHTDAHVHEDL